MHQVILALLVSYRSIAAPTFTKEIKPIFEKRCSVCHGPNNPHSIPNWEDYDTSYNKRELIKDRVWTKRDMPMGATMPDSERDLVRKWVDGGAKK